MSVTMPNRGESEAEFIAKMRKICLEIGKVQRRMDKEDRSIYGEILVKTSIEALQKMVVGNGIYLSKHTSDEMFNNRVDCFTEARGLVDSIPSIYSVYIESWADAVGANNKAVARKLRSIERLSGMCSAEIGMLTNLIKSDKKRYKDYKS